MSERLSRAEEIFHAVADAGPERREAMLSELCSGDAELRVLVERLLTHDREGMRDFLGAPGDPLLGTTLSKYRVLEAIGAGGMGVVYRAHDERLDRDVALKILPAGAFADESARKRFRKEALALSKLNHPNIATVHDFDRAGDTDFLIMEYVAGSTLREELASGPMPEKDVARLGAQLAEGLAAAHLEGIIHRDLKPENVRLTSDGRLKILDFGLAKLVLPLDASAATATMSESQGAIGTLPYMAPEQVLAEELDARCDVYGAGAVLYEMSTGTRPFSGKIHSRLADAILHHPPVTPRSLNPQVSTDLEWIILKCLEKDPGLRYQSARELHVDLERLRTGAPVASPVGRPPRKRRSRLVVLGIALLGVALASALAFGLQVWNRGHRVVPAWNKEPSIAVLYFDDFGAAGEDENLAAGITEDVITALSQVPGLHVVSRTAMDRYRNTKVDPRRVGRDLDVDYVLEGSVRLAGSKLRITAQLVQASDALHVWAGKFDGSLADIFAVQDTIATRIASELRTKVGAPDRARIAKHWTENAKAYAYYLSGRETYSDGARLEATAEARKWFEKAIALDPDYAPALAGLGAVISKEWSFGHWPAGGLERALDLARKAQALDPSFAHAWRVEAAIWGARDDRTRQADALQRAMKASPLETENYVAMAWMNRSLGRRDRATQLFRQAIEMDPHLVSGHLGLSSLYRDAGQFTDAEKAVSAGLRLLPGDPRLLMAHAENLLSGGDREGAIRTLGGVLRARPDILEAHTRLGTLLREAGSTHEADSVFALALRRWPDHPRVLDWYGSQERRRGRYEVADSVFRRAAQLDPDFYTARRNLVYTEMDRRHPDRAESLFLEILKRWPDEASACGDLARFYYDQRRYKSAEEWSKRTIQLAPGRPSAHSQLGQAYLSQGDLPRAIQAFRKVIALKSDDFAAYRDLSVSLGAAGKYREALSAAEQATKLRPDYLKGWLALGNANLNLNRIHRAAVAYERAIEVDSTSAGAYNNLALCYVAEGRHEKALQVYRRATRLDPSGTAPWINISELARIYLRDERLAREAALESIKRGQGTIIEAMGLLQLGSIEDRHGSRAVARGYYIRGLAIAEPLFRKYPRGLNVTSTTGHLYARLGESGKALKLAALLAATEHESVLSLYDAACIAAAAGDRNRAFEYLELAVGAGFDDRDLVSRDPDLDGIRTDPRFKQILASVQ